jgi:ubiquinone/menaquinone biosynthesis C-methylase UbiE
MASRSRKNSRAGKAGPAAGPARRRPTEPRKRKGSGAGTGLSPTERDDLFYAFLAGEARSSLLRSVVQIGLPELLADHGPMTEADILGSLAVHPQRGRKWFLLLRYVGLVEEAAGNRRTPPTYRNSPFVQALFEPQGRGGYFYRDFLRYWHRSAAHEIVDVLRGLPVVESVPYPPKTMEDTALLHAWMKHTAQETFAKIHKHVNFGKARRLLDVAGGDGTMATHIVTRYPKIQVTVFNLPAAAYLARQQVTGAGLTDRVCVVEGDFFTDKLPDGFDMLMFSRVLADWPQDVCRTLLAKAHDALSPGGTLLICEPLADENPALAVAWEHSYLPYDDFGYQLYKPLEIYRQLLQETGFALSKVHHRDKNSIHSVLLATRL